GAGAGLEAGLGACRADGPAGLRLMAGEAGASIPADILEECIAGGMCDATRLEGRDLPAGVMIGTEFWDDLRRWLGASVIISVLEDKHLLDMLNCPTRPISRFSLVDGVGILRGCRVWQNVQQTGIREARG